MGGKYLPSTWLSLTSMLAQLGSSVELWRNFLHHCRFNLTSGTVLPLLLDKNSGKSHDFEGPLVSS